MNISISDIINPLEQDLCVYDGYQNAHIAPNVQVYYREEFSIVILFGYIVFCCLEHAWKYLVHPKIHLYLSKQKNREAHENESS